MTDLDVRQTIDRLARELGFDRVGVARAESLGRSEYLRAWLGQGRAGHMHYLHRNLASRENPAALLPGARSVIVAALNYYQPEPRPPDDGPRGRVARYAWGRDYHRVVKKRLWKLVERLRAEVAKPFEARVCVDTAPILERELAARAGIGWIGKNTMVLSRGLGSYFYLGEIITTLDLPADEPAADHCGSCTKCLEACPTGALPEPYKMDASRCISYLTIELRDAIPDELQHLIGDWVFGCDICQDVCPFNRKAPNTTDPDLAPRPPALQPLLADLLAWTPDDYDAHTRGSALRRAALDMLRRNAQIAHQNTTASEA
jgi:epoxyqueuosine reductase